MLRTPLEDRMINISRSGISLSYPSNFILVGSMNPCPCGYYGSNVRECKCTDRQRMLYISKLSGPMIDRFDLQVKVPVIEYEKFECKNIEKSAQIKRRVNKARKIQMNRYKDIGFFSNAELTPKYIEKYCVLDKEAKEILRIAFNKNKFSARVYSKILKVSRTIADLDESDSIKKEHVLEAIQYRTLDGGE